MGPQVRLVLGNIRQGYSPWVLLKGKTPQFPCAVCFSGAHRLDQHMGPESLTLQVHLISKCTEYRWGLVCSAVTALEERNKAHAFQHLLPYCCQTSPEFLVLCFSRVIQRKKRKHIWKKEQWKNTVLSFLSAFSKIAKRKHCHVEELMSYVKLQ